MCYCLHGPKTIQSHINIITCSFSNFCLSSEHDGSTPGSNLNRSGLLASATSSSNLLTSSLVANSYMNSTHIYTLSNRNMQYVSCAITSFWHCWSSLSIDSFSGTVFLQTFNSRWSFVTWKSKFTESKVTIFYVCAPPYVRI